MRCALCAVNCVLLLSSCDHKDLCYMHPHTTRIKVVYDWTDAPDANPDGMSAYFYSTDNDGQYYRFDFPGGKGDYVDLPMGNYVLITYNNDTELATFSSVDKYDEHIVTTRTGDILEPMYGNGVTSTIRKDGEERVVITPDALFGCHATDIAISDHKVKYTHTRADAAAADSDQIITLFPHDMLCHYSYEVRNVKNANHISRISGAISGMAGQMNLSTEKLHTESVTLPLYATVVPDSAKVTGQFLTFGHNEDNPDPHRMSFYVIMDDGSKYSFKTGNYLDVTQQVHSAPDKRHVHLVIDSLNIPTPIDNGNGFKPNVEDWGVIEEDIKI